MQNYSYLFIGPITDLTILVFSLVLFILSRWSIWSKYDDLERLQNQKINGEIHHTDFKVKIKTLAAVSDRLLKIYFASKIGIAFSVVHIVVCVIHFCFISK